MRGKTWGHQTISVRGQRANAIGFEGLRSFTTG